MDMLQTRVTLTYYEIRNIRGALEYVLDRKKNLAKVYPKNAGYAEDIQKLESLLSKLDKASKRAIGIRDRDRLPRR